MVLEKGVKVVRSPSEILAFLKSCDTSAEKNVYEDVQLTSCSTTNCVTTLTQNTQNVPKKLFKPLGPKRMFKSNVHASPQVSESKHLQETKDIVNQQSNTLKNKKLVLI